MINPLTVNWWKWITDRSISNKLVFWSRYWFSNSGTKSSSKSHSWSVCWSVVLWRCAVNKYLSVNHWSVYISCYFDQKETLALSEGFNPDTNLRVFCPKLIHCRWDGTEALYCRDHRCIWVIRQSGSWCEVGRPQKNCWEMLRKCWMGIWETPHR